MIESHDSDDEFDDFPPDNGLCLELAPFKLERLEDYEPGGHHPVQLGDALGDDSNYIVIHKLGQGGFANIWLCRDQGAGPQTRYIALKILMAEASVEDCSELRMLPFKKMLEAGGNRHMGAEYVCFPIGKFNIKGPNGTHYCFIYPVLGPKVSLGLYRGSENPDQVLRTICLRTGQAIDFLHKHKICHGDITPSNVLHQISGLDGLSEVEVLRVLGSPRLNRVYDPDLGLDTTGHSNPSAPQYLVYPVDWQAIDSKFLGINPCVIDFGQSFEVTHPPEDLGVPGPYRAPELILEQKAGYGSDLWALGCTIFEIRTGRKLFDLFDDDDDAYLDAMVQVLGVMPEPWWSVTWLKRKQMFEDRADKSGKAILIGDDKGHVNPNISRRTHPSVAEGARSILEKLAPGLWYLSILSRKDDCHRDIEPVEKELFANLLDKLLKFEPDRRLSAEDALQHEWFQGDMVPR